ncbi:sodium/potassium/calcium exchanger 1-like [Seriola lalandi dorsalis]|uniref:sodium/potassium/calcium exchanger 1-like n=1 Tax=Seriola lalandi dorsalis TaxID=1841481 RepID=UPI000C6F5625|nr:sodium/potassium/calcium exchanger 1-like [Seriola lalandi dorsalis]
MNCATGKRLQLSQVLLLLSGVFLYQLTISARLYEPLPVSQSGDDFGEDSTEGIREVTVETQGLEEPLTAAHELEPTDQITLDMHMVNHLNTTTDFKASTPTESPPLPGERGEYPKDIFSVEERRRGWVVLHIFGMLYMFVSLAIVCDEFFVPALEVITEKLGISDDVTGATFMAAGRSTPKFFAYLIGVFIAHSNVGIDTIVGSAIFNILFVIGMCALFSREVVHLTWWPLLRDVSFYIFDLILLIIFFLDNVIMWWESMMLVAGYTVYVIFMKFNVQIEQAVKTQLYKHKNIVKVIAVEEPEKVNTPAGEDGSGGPEEFDSDKEENNKDSDESSKNDCENKDGEEEEEEKKDKPLSLEWPDTRCKQAIYLFLLPIVFPLWLTVPDVRKQKSRKFFVVTFLGCILWIAVFSYLIVWWAYRISETVGISHQIMTILAAEISIPDLITSVIVARKGQGDMAVSSCVGSNIFDITAGMPVPWLLYSSIHSSAPVAVSSNGLLLAVVLLFLMLLFVIIIASCKWKMNKLLGCIMLLLYFLFLLLRVMVQ